MYFSAMQYFSTSVILLNLLFNVIDKDHPPVCNGSVIVRVNQSTSTRGTRRDSQTMPFPTYIGPYREYQSFQNVYSRSQFTFQRVSIVTYNRICLQGNLQRVLERAKFTTHPPRCTSILLFLNASPCRKISRPLNIHPYTGTEASSTCEPNKPCLSTICSKLICIQMSLTGTASKILAGCLN